MRESKTRPILIQQPATKNLSAASLLYEPLDFVMVRAPLLPVEVYLALGDTLSPDGAEGSTNLLAFEEGSLIPCDSRICRALAVGSTALLDDLKRSSPSDKDAHRLKGKLLRFLIRMSTRPTPFGLFAGVALGQWGQETDLALAAEPPRTRTRPDMALLLTLVRTLESRLDIRKHLRLVANPTAFFQGERVYITERSSIGEASAASAVSVRATSVVKRALAAAREPVLYENLVESLLATTPHAMLDKVERLITELWQHTLLLTDLRPPLTTESPTRYVVKHLADIPTAKEALTQLEATLEAAATYDMLPAEEGIAAYQRLAEIANEVNKAAGETPVQIDMALALHGRHITEAVSAEISRAAELLLRMTPLPNGLPSLQAYRQAFVLRYGHNREVPLLELLDPTFGLGPPMIHGSGNGGISPAKATLRSQTLLHLAFNALQDRKQVIELDEDTLACLETWMPSLDTAPTSLDLNVFIAASSRGALDAGEFQVIIGPNLGAQAAGRNLGRFADLIGLEAQEALKRAACAEARQDPQKLWAELVYLPRKLRSANVVIHPTVRSHEIAIGTSPGVATDRVIPLDELMVGIHNNRFYVRWLAENTNIVISSGHMLNNMQAPGICRFLAEVSRDGIAQLSTFDWGPASNFPFLPRIQAGRIVLRPAQWRIDTLTRTHTLPPDSPMPFREALGHWRELWRVPRHVYLSMGDNRLLLDLESAGQVEELRTEVRHLRDGGHLVLQEVLPGLDQIWLEGPEGHYVSELVASLVLRKSPVQGQRATETSSTPPQTCNPFPMKPVSTVLPADRLRPPGSEWLFVKLYCNNAFEEHLIAYPLRIFAAEVLSAELAREWFFIRYNDPGRHIRFRLRGEPEQLVGQLLPKLCTWATALMTEGVCSHFVFDTYDREVERYGGTAGIQLAESAFAVDSCTVSELIYLLQERTLQLDRITLAVLSVDHLLASLGMTEAARLQWLRQYVTSRKEVGQEYRQRKSFLRPLLHDPHRLLNETGGAFIAQVFASQRAALAPVAERLLDLTERGELNQAIDVLYNSFVHMHCNRLFNFDQSAEQRVLGLLLRTREGLDRSSNG
jgi:lantibiotic biosynthesis protein